MAIWEALCAKMRLVEAQRAHRKHCYPEPHLGVIPLLGSHKKGFYLMTGRNKEKQKQGSEKNGSEEARECSHEERQKRPDLAKTEGRQETTQGKNDGRSKEGRRRGKEGEEGKKEKREGRKEKREGRKEGEEPITEPSQDSLSFALL